MRPTIVLVPGLDGTAELFYRQIPLLERHFDVLTFPLPDCAVRGMGELVSDLADHIRESSEGPVVLCGESFGGALSMSFALAHPEIVRGLVIVNSFPVIRTPWKLHLAPLALRLVPWGAMTIVRRFTEHRLHSRHALDEDLHEFRERSRKIGRLGYIRRLEILQDYDLRERLREIEAPTLLLAGDQDQLVPSVTEARFMAERIPDATVHVLEGYGHICLINHDLDLCDTVMPWFEARVAAREPAGPSAAADR